ncbi:MULTISPECIES: ABC transporter ATP-binding protein [unclassified Nesterenkonia]|uniref:ABC transporter ATP-binding protein n=1 Tax=unclassified Nesterenkonia TaxID=2629769 RepID=UPI000872B7D0|nr:MULTISPECIES: ABC transporter ATP-binding protein [unclassified Nesterenkonia]MDS2173407.1 ABC transporter ATP-binding protein [Nesterenkonia sp. CL21]OSM42203.1 ABC transporter ATP-binding protein [Nesterenkonia sp. PF2B19]
MSENPPVIRTEKLVKRFGAVRALDELDLTIATGEVHGFLGPNGAGKSTTMRVLLGLLRADSGTVEMFGRDPWRHAVALHRRLAYVPGDVELWPNLTGGEVIDMFLRLRGPYSTARRDELIERFALDPRKKTRTYSKGNRQKVALISALASDVDLLLLDEPTAGLDPLMEVVFQQTIKEATQNGRSVLLSSHILAQVEALSDRISIIRAGQVVESGTLSELRHMTRTTIEVETARPAGEIAGMSGVHDFRTEGERIIFEVDGERVEDLMHQLAPLGVRSLVAHPPTLEQLLMRHYGEDLGHRSVAEGAQKG